MINKHLELNHIDKQKEYENYFENIFKEEYNSSIQIYENAEEKIVEKSIE